MLRLKFLPLLTTIVVMSISCKTNDRGSTTSDIGLDPNAVEYKLALYPTTNNPQACKSTTPITMNEITSSYPVKMKLTQPIDFNCNYTVFLVIAKNEGTSADGKKALTVWYTNHNATPTEAAPSGKLINIKPLAGIDGYHSLTLYKHLNTIHPHVKNAEAIVNISGSKTPAFTGSANSTEVTITVNACDDQKCFEFNPATGASVEMN